MFEFFLPTDVQRLAVEYGFAWFFHESLGSLGKSCLTHSNPAFFSDFDRLWEVRFPLMKFCYENITCCGLFSLQLNSHLYWFHLVFHPLVAPLDLRWLRLQPRGCMSSCFILWYLVPWWHDKFWHWYGSPPLCFRREDLICTWCPIGLLEDPKRHRII